MAMLLYVANDNRLLAAGLHTYDETGTKVYLDASATVAVTLTDDAGVNVAGETWPLALDYIAGSHGDYQAVLRNELVLVAGREVTGTLVIDAGDNQHGELTGRLLVQTRQF